MIFKFRFFLSTLRTMCGLGSCMSAADQLCQKSARILTLSTSTRLLRLFPCRYGVLAVKRAKELREQRPSQWVLWNLEILENLKRVVQVLQTHQQTDPNKRELPKPCATSSTKSKGNVPGGINLSPFHSHRGLITKLERSNAELWYLNLTGTWRDMKNLFVAGLRKRRLQLMRR